jgi:hypothetical protein
MSSQAKAVAGQLSRAWKAYPAYRPSGVEWLGDIPVHWHGRSWQCGANSQIGY